MRRNQSCKYLEEYFSDKRKFEHEDTKVLGKEWQVRDQSAWLKYSEEGSKVVE